MTGPEAGEVAPLAVQRKEGSPVAQPRPLSAYCGCVVLVLLCQLANLCRGGRGLGTPHLCFVCVSRALPGPWAGVVCLEAKRRGTGGGWPVSACAPAGVSNPLRLRGRWVESQATHLGQAFQDLDVCVACRPVLTCIIPAQAAGELCGALQACVCAPHQPQSTQRLHSSCDTDVHATWLQNSTAQP